MKFNIKSKDKKHFVPETSTPSVDHPSKTDPKILSVKTIDMNPQQFIKLAQGTSDDASIRKQSFEKYKKEQLSEQKIARFEKAFKRGEKFPTPYILYTPTEHEGRHRSEAATRVGIKSIPVHLITVNKRD